LQVANAIIIFNRSFNVLKSANSSLVLALLHRRYSILADNNGNDCASWRDKNDFTAKYILRRSAIQSSAPGQGNTRSSICVMIIICNPLFYDIKERKPMVFRPSVLRLLILPYTRYAYSFLISMGLKGNGSSLYKYKL